MVGRKSRRAHDLATGIGQFAPDLSRACDRVLPKFVAIAQCKGTSGQDRAGGAAQIRRGRIDGQEPNRGRAEIFALPFASPEIGADRRPVHGSTDQATFSGRLRPFCFSKKMVTRAISAGVIPLMRPAWPSVAGRIFKNFWRASALSPAICP
jgi:hypothetical protein